MADTQAGAEADAASAAGVNIGEQPADLAGEEAAARLAFEQAPSDVRAATRLVAALLAQGKPLPDDFHEAALRLQLRERPHDMALTYSLVALLCQLGRAPLPDQSAPADFYEDGRNLDRLLQLADERAQANDPFGVYAALWQICVRFPQEQRGWAEFARRFADNREWSFCIAAASRVLGSTVEPDKETASCLLVVLRALMAGGHIADVDWSNWLERLPVPLRSSKDAVDLLILLCKFPEVEALVRTRPHDQPIDNLVIVGLPKCGNMFFVRTMQATLQCDHVPFSIPPGNNEIMPQELIQFILRKRSVGGEHLLPTERNLRLLEQVGVTHIALLLRDPRDAIVSLWHHLNRPDIRAIPWVTAENVATGVIGPDYYDLSQERRLRQLINSCHAGIQQWMLQWLELAEESSRFKFHINRFEEFAPDPRGALKRMLRFFGHDIEPVLAETQGENSGGVNIETHFRRGEAGSYRDETTPELRDLFDRELNPAFAAKYGLQLPIDSRLTRAKVGFYRAKSALRHPSKIFNRKPAIGQAG